MEGDGSDDKYKPPSQDVMPLSPSITPSTRNLCDPKHLCSVDSSVDGKCFAPPVGGSATYEAIDVARAWIPVAASQAQYSISDSRLLQFLRFIPDRHRPKCPGCFGSTAFEKISSMHPISAIYTCSSGICYASRRPPVSLPLDSTSKEAVLCYVHEIFIPMERDAVYFDGDRGQVWRYRDPVRTALTFCGMHVRI
jgi:hypothetical protein